MSTDRDHYSMRQYGREDIDYASWYTPWMQRLARSHTAEELQRRLHGVSTECRLAMALEGALEIHELFPEHAKGQDHD